jgi:esterase/lipase superfamily enzyme
MQAACRWLGTAAGLLLLTAVVAGCGAQTRPTVRHAKPDTRASSESTPSTPDSTAKTAAKPATAPKPATASKPAPKANPASAPKAPGLTALVGMPKAKPAAAPQPHKAAPTKPQPAAEAPVAKSVPLPAPTPAAAATTAEEDPDADKQLGNSVVKVYYATDRSPIDVFQWRQSLRAGWPLLTALFAVVAVVLIIWWRREGWVLRTAAWAALAASLILGGLTLAGYFQPPLENKRIERMYGSDRGDMELGVCEVSIPKDHRVGELESPSVLRLEFREDPERHVVLQAVHPQPADQFYTDLRTSVGQTARKDIFVFIHGYNVGFQNAVRRTAQIAYDLKFEGAAIAYSWPSQEGLLGYTVDETNVGWTVPHLKEFLRGIAERSGAKSVYLVAHSMGNRALAAALREMVLEQKADCPKFAEVVLTAPDIDADEFRRDLAPAIVSAAGRVTLYASSNDEALIASRKVHGYRRAGDSGDAMVVVSGVDTVDVSEIDTSFIGHSYYGSNSTVLADLFELIRDSKPPDQRKWLQAMPLGALKYWKFLRSMLDKPAVAKTL